MTKWATFSKYWVNQEIKHSLMNLRVSKKVLNKDNIIYWMPLSVS